MQSAFFFLYNGTVCLAFFLMLGTVGWRSSLSFVRHIYRYRHPPCTETRQASPGASLDVQDSYHQKTWTLEGPQDVAML